MLIREKFENVDFSHNEEIIVQYILKKGASIKHMTTKEIAHATFTSPSSLLRIAHKMGYDGWNDLKQAYVDECLYLESHFCSVDANYPFSKNDSIMSIAAKIAKVKEEAIEDTLSLIGHDDLQKVVKLLADCENIYVFAVSNNLNVVQEFKHNMARIRRRVEITCNEGEQVFSASLMDAHDCAIIVSYSGETNILKRVARTLNARHIPFVAITNIGNNSIGDLANVNLKICTREMLFSKIATFTTDEAITYLLDVLYSCIFCLHYDENVSLRKNVSRIVEKNRFSSTKTISEEIAMADVYDGD